MMKSSALLFFLLVNFSVGLHAQNLDLKNSNFNKADSIAALYPKHSLRDLKALADKLTQPLSTDEEKFRSIYVWVCDNIENDYELYLKTRAERNKIKSPEEFKAWNKKFTSRVFKNLVDKQKTICSGYAYLLKELAMHAGLSCVIINGYGRTAQANIRGSGVPNHSWNAVQLNNKWYLCDATWSSGAVDTQEAKFVKKFTEAYFLADPSLFVRNHYPLDSSWMLLSEKPTLNEFLNGPLIYSSIYDYKITQLLPATFDVTALKGKTVSFQFSNNTDKDRKSCVTNQRAEHDKCRDSRTLSCSDRALLYRSYFYHQRNAHRSRSFEWQLCFYIYSKSEVEAPLSTPSLLFALPG